MSQGAGRSGAGRSRARASLSAFSFSAFSFSSFSLRSLASFFTCSSSAVCRSYQACMFLGLTEVLASSFGHVSVSTLAIVIESRPTEASAQVERSGSMALWKARCS